MLSGTDDAQELAKVGFSYFDKGDLGRAKDSFAALVALVSEKGDEQQQAWAFKSLATVERRMGSLRSALRNCESALQLLPPGDRGPLLAEIVSTRGNIRADLGELEAAAADLRRSLEIYEEHECLKEYADVLNNLGTVRAKLGDHEGARDTFEKALSLAESAGDENLLSQARNNLALALMASAEFGAAQRLLKADLAYCRSKGDRYGEAIAESNLGELERQCEDHEKAKAHYERAVEILTEVGAAKDLVAVTASLQELV